MIPTEWDKPEVSRRVAEAGAGILIPPSQCTPERLREAVERVLSDPSYREQARRLAADFKRHGGPAEAARLLEELSVKAPSRLAARTEVEQA
jgi:UDP:flavonoid glycosyltransferase YjiC (YdhE family)